MIAYIKGKITHREPAGIVVETGGIGYHINISLHTYTSIENAKECQLYIYTHFKHDAQSLAAVDLYGFADLEEKEIFMHLISVSGISAATARVMLSSFSPVDVRRAILSEDVKMIQSIKGIGPKLAQRTILELKDKLKKSQEETISVKINQNVGNTVYQEALSALISLGFTKSSAENALRKLLANANQQIAVEDLIKQALKIL